MWRHIISGGLGRWAQPRAKKLHFWLDQFWGEAPMEGETDPAPVRADADVAIEKVVARLGVLDRTFTSAGHR